MRKRNKNIDMQDMICFAVKGAYLASGGDIKEFIKTMEKANKDSFDKLKGDYITKQLSQIEFDAHMITAASLMLRESLSKDDYKLLGGKLEDLGKELKEIGEKI